MSCRNCWNKISIQNCTNEDHSVPCEFPCAQECYKDQGTKALRRSNNAALLRCYCALENGEKAGERFKVALTMVETKEDAGGGLLEGADISGGFGRT